MKVVRAKAMLWLPLTCGGSGICRLSNVHPLQAGLWGRAAHLAVKTKISEDAYVFQEVPPGQNATPALSVVDIMSRFNIPAFDIVKVGGAGRHKPSSQSDLSRGCGSRLHAGAAPVQGGSMHASLNTPPPAVHAKEVALRATVQLDIEGAEGQVFAPGADLSWLRPQDDQLVVLEVRGVVWDGDRARRRRCPRELAKVLQAT